MPLVATSAIIGPALDWAVATLEKMPIKKDPMGFGRQSPGGYWIWPDMYPPRPTYMQIGKQYSPSTDWAQGGPIIERKWIELGAYEDQWRAVMHMEHGSLYLDGSTPLIAAMRCFVLSELGPEIEVPAELLGD